MPLQISTVTTAQRDDALRVYCTRSLANFIKTFWHVLEPTTELKWDWPLDAITVHLEAITRGYMIPPRFLANVPPGTMKSLSTSVFWPAWEWGPMQKAHNRFLGTSHAKDLALRDSNKFRNIIVSPLFQRLWPTRLTKETESLLINDKLGFREATAFTGMTGKRGDRVILDDPLAAGEADSDADRLKAARTFRETLQTRLNDQEKSAIAVIMQRLHEGDTSGIIEELEMPYTRLILPMRYEPDRHCRTFVTFNGQRVQLFSDPRKVEGELLFPSRFPEQVVSQLERDLGSYAAAGQLQQRPSPRGGGIIKREWFEIVAAAPAGTVWVRGWDLAGTAKKTSPFTAGVLMGKGRDGTFYIADVTRGQIDAAQVKKYVKNVATQDRGRFSWGVHISVPQDPGQAGKVQVSDYAKEFAGFNIHFSPESGEKLIRALPFAAQAEAGNIKLVAGPWVEPFLDELASFPTGKFKDQVDAASRAFGYLLEMKAYPIESAM